VDFVEADEGVCDCRRRRDPQHSPVKMEAWGEAAAVVVGIAEPY